MISTDEKRWREEDDARTLAEAERIKNDPGRLSGAKTAAKRMVEEDKERIQAMSKVAGKGSTASRPKSVAESRKKTVNAHNIFTRI